MNVGLRVSCEVCGAMPGIGCRTLDDDPHPTEAHDARRELEEANAAAQAELDAEPREPPQSP